MPSLALQRWFGELADALDEIENAHRAVGGSGPGRRTATQHLNQAYAVLLAAQFQGFCRELHTECAAHLAAGVADVTLRALFRSSYVRHRMLDRGNANADNIGSDFGCFNLSFWASVDAHRSQNPRRRALLKNLNEWRTPSRTTPSPRQCSAGDVPPSGWPRYRDGGRLAMGWLAHLTPS